MNTPDGQFVINADHLPITIDPSVLNITNLTESKLNISIGIKTEDVRKYFELGLTINQLEYSTGLQYFVPKRGAQSELPK